MDARQLEYFLAVVDHGGVNRAAQALFLAQPSLSQAIRALERDLGSPLFHRVGRRVVLTQAGHALVEPARQVVRGLAHARASVESAAGLQVGRVEIAAMSTQAVEPLSDLIRRFTARHPGLSVAVRAGLTVPDVLDMVRSGRTELGLLASFEPLTAVGIDLIPLGVQRFVLITAADGPFRGEVVRREQLAGQRLIVGQVGTGMRRFVEDIRASSIDVVVVVETEHRSAVLPLVLSGVGMAVIAEAWRHLAEQAGALVFDIEPSACLHVALASRKSGLTPQAEAFVDLVR